MTSLKLSRIAASLGIVGTDQLQAWLYDARFSQDDVARMCGTSPQHFADLLAADEPTPVVVTSQHVEG